MRNRHYEFERQLKRQDDGLKDMSPDEVVDKIEKVEQDRQNGQ